MLDYMFVSSDGTLFDTRKEDWSNHPLRVDYAKHYRDIDTTKKLLATIRAGEFAWPGGYRLFFIASDGASLSFDAVKDNLYQVVWSIRNNVNDGWRVVACDNSELYDEEALYCSYTNEQLN